MGNLVQRTISMGHKYFEGKVSNKKISDSVDETFISKINDLDKSVTESMDDYHVSDALSNIFNLFRDTNKYIDETAPWVLAKDESKKDRLDTVLYNLLEAIRVGAVLLEPFMPDTSEKILTQLNISDKSLSFNENNNYELNKAEPLFNRIEVK